VPMGEKPCYPGPFLCPSELGGDPERHWNDVAAHCCPISDPDEVAHRLPGRAVAAYPVPVDPEGERRVGVP
jgi:hypothetical protein